MKLSFAQIEPFLSAPPSKCRIFLLYGPDEGMNRMRARALIEQWLGQKPDPFALIEWPESQIAERPAALADELNTLPFGGQKKLVYIRAASDAATAAVNGCLRQCPDFARLIIESGELPPKSSLRQLIESDEQAVAIPAYDDEGRGLEQFVRRSLADAKLQIDSGAMPVLLSLLSGNRMVNHNELQKLMLYVFPQSRIRESDVEACLSDQSNIDLDDVVYAAFSGQNDILIQGIGKLRGEGVFATAILRAISRHAMRLHWCGSLIAAGMDHEEAVKMLRPPVFFKKLPQFRAQLQKWGGAPLIKLLVRLTDAEIQCKSTGYPADDIAAQILLGIAHQSRPIAKAS